MHNQGETFSHHLKPGNNFPSDFQLKAHVPKEAIIPTLQKMCGVSEQPVETSKRVGITQWAVPCPLYDVEKP
jgi:hypothetical protein